MAYAAITLSELRDRLDAKHEHKPFWEAEEARLALNEALRWFNLLTARWRTRTTIQTVTTLANLYTVPAAMLFRMRMTFVSQPMASSAREDFINIRPRWRSESTTIGGDVPTRPVAWAPVSLNRFYIWPADAIGDRTLTLDGVAATPVLVEDADALDLGEDLIDILLGYALHVLAFKKGGIFFAATLPYYKAFLAAAAEENDQIKTSQIYRQIMGLDRRGLKPLRGTPTALDALAERSA